MLVRRQLLKRRRAVASLDQRWVVCLYHWQIHLSAPGPEDTLEDPDGLNV